jgi:ribosomal protein S21
MGVSIREGEPQDSLLCRFQRMMQMSGILCDAKSHRHFLGKDYEIKQKEEH